MEVEKMKYYYEMCDSDYNSATSWEVNDFIKLVRKENSKNNSFSIYYNWYHPIERTFISDTMLIVDYEDNKITFLKYNKRSLTLNNFIEKMIDNKKYDNFRKDIRKRL